MRRGRSWGLDPAAERRAGNLLVALPPVQPPGAPCRRRHRSRPPRAAATQSGPADPAATRPAAAPWPGARRAGGRAGRRELRSRGAAEPARGGAGRGGAGQDRAGRAPAAWAGPEPGAGTGWGCPAARPGGGAGGTGPRRGGEAPIPCGAGSEEALPPTTGSRVLQVGRAKPSGLEGRGKRELYPCHAPPNSQKNTNMLLFFLQNVFIFLETEK